MISPKKVFLWGAKLLVMNALALLAMSAFSYFYFDPNATIPPIANETGNRYNPNARICRCLEGRFCGHVDANGYNNAFYIEKGKDVSQCDALVFGSSHTEAWQVPGNNNFTYLLNRKFEEKNGPSFYSIGVSSHGYERVFLHMDDALEYFKPTEYAIIEAGKFPEKHLNALVTGRATDADFGFKDSALTRFIAQKVLNADNAILYHATLGVRLIYFNVRLFLKKQNRAERASARTQDYEVSDDDIDRFLQMQADIAKKHGVQLIVVGHWRLILQKDGTCEPAVDSDMLATYQRLCREKGIVFIDMTPIFMKEYEEKNLLPYGCFMNDLAGYGHLNKTGHRLIADEIANTIERLEEEEASK